MAKNIKKISKILITVAAFITIIVPTVMDLNSTHMTNPLWPPHARFHWSIQWYSITMLNCIALYLLWGRYRERNSRISLVVAALSPLLFWGSFFPSLLMPGVSSWPDGIEPFSKVAPNVILAVIISAVCIFAIAMDAYSRKQACA